MSMRDLLLDGRADSEWTLALAHGAGQGMFSDFMTSVAKGLTALGDPFGGLRVVRFEFPYMERARAAGSRRPPDREPVLLERWRQVIEELEKEGASRQRLLIGGKSLGGRMASLIASEQNVAGLICFGYPFHPPGKPQRLRIQHLQSLRIPTLICQGVRDPFGGPDEVATYPLSRQIRLYWLADGDHGFKPRKSSGLTLEHNMTQALAAVGSFVADLAASVESGTDADRGDGS